jgi:hypothetical protein
MTPDTPQDIEVADVRDPEEYTNERRLKDIFDARSDIREKRLQAQEAARTDRLTAVSAYRSAVSNYLLEVEPLLRQHEPGTQLLTERDFGSIVIEPPTKEKEAPGRTTTTRQIIEVPKDTYGTKEVPVKDIPDPAKYHLTGLRSLFTAPNPVEHEFTFIADNTYRQRDKYTLTQRTQISFQTLDTMVRTINNFLGEAGLELNPDTGGDTAEVDYSDLV